MNKVKKAGVDGKLTRNEKIQVIITLLLTTAISWIIYYYGWKGSLPIKAKQVNSYLLKLFLVLGAVAITALALAVFFSTRRG
ncbi:MAG: hypothetical protein Q7S44_03920 [bacterium]|nr:hypothetical protein [bacterium]